MEETKSLGRELVETVDFLVQAEQKRRTEL